MSALKLIKNKNELKCWQAVDVQVELQGSSQKDALQNSNSNIPRDSDVAILAISMNINIFFRYFRF